MKMLKSSKFDKCICSLILITIISATQLCTTIMGKNIYSEKCSSSSSLLENTIECSRIEIGDDLTGLIEEENNNFEYNKGIVSVLSIFHLLTEDRTLSENWIQSTSFRVKRLIVEAPNIDDISDNAFRGYVFEELIALKISGLTIKVLHEGTFEGLNMLEELLIYKCNIHQIDSNTLRPLSATLRDITFEDLISPRPLDVINITGTVHLPKVKYIDFRFNDLRKLNSESFSQIENCQFVYLQNSPIEDIGCGTFERMTDLRTLILMGNRLTTLDPCVFGDDLINNMQNYTLYLSNNDWNCTCELDWLKQLKLDNVVSDNPRCYSHLCLPFEEVDFCSQNQTFINDYSN